MVVSIQIIADRGIRLFQFKFEVDFSCNTMWQSMSSKISDNLFIHFKLSNASFACFKYPSASVSSKILMASERHSCALSTLFFKQTIVNHFLGEGMLKKILQVGLDRFGFDKIEAFKPTKAAIDVVFECADSF